MYQTRFNTDAAPALSLRKLQRVCTPCYDAVVDRLSVIRARVERQFSRTVAGYEAVLKSALAEAEALAWQTPYPHLLFPALAEEKATNVQKWATHQREVYTREEVRAFAA